MPEPLHVLRWERPPDAKHPGGGSRTNMFAEVAAELREMPGTWGVVYESPSNRATGMASHIANGVYPCFRPPGAFQAVSRMRDGVRTLYVRYVGEGSKS